MTGSSDGYLIIRLSSIGDVVLTEPVVAAVREARPDAAIGFVVKDRFRDLVAANPAVDRLHTLGDGSFRSLLGLTREIRDAGYSNVVDLHSNARSLFISRRSGASRVSRYQKRSRGDGFAVRVLHRPYRATKKLVTRYLEALAPLGVPHGYRAPRFHVSPEDARVAEALLAARGLRGGEFAVVVPGSVWATKRWPEDRFASLASRISSELGLRVLVTGGTEEAELCERVAAAGGASSVAGELGLGATAALLARAGLFVGNDSGPTHVSMALDVPTVAIFGPTDPSQFDFARHALVYADLPCSACSFFGGRRCRLGHWTCMRSIGVEDVMSAARGLMERRSRA